MMPRIIRKLGPRKLLCLSLDALSFLIAIYFVVRQGKDSLSVKEFLESSPLFLGTALLTLFSFRRQNLYKIRIMYSNLRQIMILSKNVVSTFLTLLVLQFFFTPHEIQTGLRIHFALFVCLSFALVGFNRFVVFRLITKGIKPSEVSLKIAVAIGAGRLGVSTARTLKKNRELGYNLVGFVDDKKELHGEKVEGVEVCGKIDDLEKIVLEHDVEEIFITINDIDHEDLFGIIERCKNVRCPINVVSDHFDVVERKVNEAEFDELRFVTMFPRPDSLYQTTLKRFLDLVFGFLIAVLISPLLLVLALLVKMTSKGPSFTCPRQLERTERRFGSINSGQCPTMFQTRNIESSLRISSPAGSKTE